MKKISDKVNEVHVIEEYMDRKKNKKEILFFGSAFLCGILLGIMIIVCVEW